MGWTDYCSGKGLFARKRLAIDLKTGEEIWRNEKIRSEIGYTSATFWNELLFVCGMEKLYVVNAENGTVKLTLPYGSVSSSPCVYFDKIFFGVRGRRYLAANALTGEILWTYDAGSIIHFTPAAMNNEVYCASVGSVFALDVETGILKWRRDFGDDSPIPMDSSAVFRNSLLVAIRGLGLVNLSTESGEVNWQFATRYGPFSAPSVAEDDGVVYVAGRRLYSVSLSTGEELWSSDELGLFTSSQIIVGEHIYSGGGHDRFVYAFSRSTGEKVWEYPTGDFVCSTPAYANGRLVIGSHDGYVYCFEEE